MHQLQNTITAPQIAQIIKRRTITVMRWAGSGKLPKPICRFGITYVWDKSEVFKALESLGYLTASNDALYSENQEAQK
ncbi:hypothetical protein F939_00002 [Acinetobacter radioresistens DSM 6976 = NBRC 102413 = CIP 103788]|uniref:hypothetical protein n=1 Tax=Acinetobacter radioresistens TaxID=40216 RepID=UPI00028E594C|nr:hypothetical protein [Acinetobacter radioresistens]ENV91427.1 hypothetical protein F939_00002 [Acinetobacter radioresistens DSM 6976 = NBRC 102413 = CIP 103788]BBL22538.1 hypothetical protein ACRAD_32090 [Acinetobacter radioresistens DSM 6976 = NBRC 102413 = CIP 103788]